MASVWEGRCAKLGDTHDCELYRHIRWIKAPRFVVRLELNLGEAEVHVHLESGAASRRYDHRPERQWRHLDTCKDRTILRAKPLRSECGRHGVRVVKLFWAEPAPHLVVGENAFRTGPQHCTLVNDVRRTRVFYVAEDRTQASLEGFCQTRTPDRLGSIEAVATDMWAPCLASLREHPLGAAGDDRLTGKRYNWQRHLAGMQPEDRREFAALRNSNLKAARAWVPKEAGMPLFGSVRGRPPRTQFPWWLGRAAPSRLRPMIETAREIWNKRNCQIANCFHSGALDLPPSYRQKPGRALLLSGVAILRNTKTSVELTTPHKESKQ